MRMRSSRPARRGRAVSELNSRRAFAAYVKPRENAVQSCAPAVSWLETRWSDRSHAGLDSTLYLDEYSGRDAAYGHHLHSVHRKPHLPSSLGQRLTRTAALFLAISRNERGSR